jgi:hypothetical protein
MIHLPGNGECKKGENLTLGWHLFESFAFTLWEIKKPGFIFFQSEWGFAKNLHKVA